MGPEGGSRQGHLAALLAVALFVAAWLPLHPARPLQPDADLHGHLTVARHLVRDEGFRTDVTYPLSFAFDFARELPQPLLTAQPGLPLLLTLPCLTADLDPDRTLTHARVLHLVLLALVAWLGVRALQRAGRTVGVLAWFLLLAGNRFLPFAVDWGFVELACGGLLLALWLRLRPERGGTAAPGPVDGLLWGLLVLFRLDLAWVPLLWWVVVAPRDRAALRGFAAAAAVALVVLSPWLVRNFQVTGNPVFALQAHAELVKDTRAFPGYTVYRDLQPVPLDTAIGEHGGAVARKAARGLRFFAGDLGRFLPPFVLLPLLYCLGLVPWRRIRRGPDSSPELIRAALATATLLLLCLQYAFFDHSLRHLLVVLPVIAWEVAWACGTGWLVSAAVGVVILLAPPGLGGWENAAAEGRRAAETRPWDAELDTAVVDGVYFFGHAAGPWHHDRPGVWRSPAAVAAVPGLLDRPITPDAPPEERP